MKIMAIVKSQILLREKNVEIKILGGVALTMCMLNGLSQVLDIPGRTPDISGSLFDAPLVIMIKILISPVFSTRSL